MNKLILCEGETDAILLSYYLGKVAGWKYSPKPPQNLSIQATAQNEAVNWYKKDEDYLLICAVGGKDNFENFFEKKIKNPLLLSDAFERVAFVTDRDERETRFIEASRYISSERLKLKAHLGLTWAVQYPEKVFTKIDEQIRNVRWEESETLHICFSTLAEI